jgi:hypothetical protein
MLKIEAEHYKVTISRRNQSTISTTTTQWREEIIITGKEANNANGESWQAFLFFVDDLASTPANSMSNTINRVFIFMSRDQFDWCLDLLRNEKPVFVVFNESSPNYSGIITDNEPVGEGEDKCCSTVNNENPTVIDNDRPQPQQNYAYDNLQITATGHSWENSYLLGLASYYIYGDWMIENNAGVEFESALRDRFTPLVRPDMKLTLISDDGFIVKNTGLQAMVMSNDDFIIVAFRGTQLNAHDWVTNFTKLAAPTQIIWAPIGAMTHPGFLGAVNTKYEEIIDAIRNQRISSDQPLFITGHSLGGSLGLIMALRLMIMNDHNVSGVYNYGCPPTTWGTFTNVYDEIGLGSLTHRWVNHRDWAPGLPLPGYGHVGISNYIGADGIATLGMQPTPFLIPQMDDHDLTNYLSLIKNNMPGNLQNIMPDVID